MRIAELPRRQAVRPAAISPSATSSATHTGKPVNGSVEPATFATVPSTPPAGFGLTIVAFAPRTPPALCVGAAFAVPCVAGAGVTGAGATGRGATGAEATEAETTGAGATGAGATGACRDLNLRGRLRRPRLARRGVVALDGMDVDAAALVARLAAGRHLVRLAVARARDQRAVRRTPADRDLRGGLAVAVPLRDVGLRRRRARLRRARRGAGAGAARAAVRPLRRRAARLDACLRVGRRRCRHLGLLGLAGSLMVGLRQAH